MKEALYRAFISPYFSYCSQEHRKRKEHRKFDRTNARALRFVYDKISTYEQLLGHIGPLSTLENRRTQDMLLIMNKIYYSRQDPIQL